MYTLIKSRDPVLGPYMERIVENCLIMEVMELLLYPDVGLYLSLPLIGYLASIRSLWG